MAWQRRGIFSMHIRFNKLLGITRHMWMDIWLRIMTKLYLFMLMDTGEADVLICDSDDLSDYTESINEFIVNVTTDRTSSWP